MGIISYTAELPGQVGVNPRRVKIITTDSLGTVTTAGYFNNQTLLQADPLRPTDFMDIVYSYNVASGTGTNAVLLLSFSSGIITASAVQTSADTTSSATPGTIRAFVGKMTGTASVMTSGNIVGVRGEVDYVGASGGFIYGVQGKIIPTGTLSGSSWNAGLFGQVDISHATINAGQIAPIWGDYGSTSGTLSDQTGMYGIAMTNTTAAVLEGQVYLYGGAQNLLYLSTNAGLSGVTYFKTAGSTSGSWGNASYPTVTKVLKISIDGTAYYLPIVAQNT